MTASSSAAGKPAARQGKERSLVLMTLPYFGRSRVEWRARREPIQSISERDRTAGLSPGDTPVTWRRRGPEWPVECGCLLRFLPWANCPKCFGLFDWYAERAGEHKWRLEVLEHQITTGLHRRVGAAPNNLEERLSEDGAVLARSVAKDPLVFDFLGLTKEVEELAMEEAMTQRMSQTLAEFGRGFAFNGRQYHLDVQGEDFYIDLLLVHVPTNRFVVIELKSGKFRPEHLGQLNFYVAAVNDLVKFAAPPWASLVCGAKNEHRRGWGAARGGTHEVDGLPPQR